ncbi:MAG: hypothetical protein E3J71_08995 [Candidatus Stahlbacteria bacterium]|nr:MAG: hypothetical protein E3J71_08995 [Candidatus Stahlbacteria bacterium]
MDANLFTAYNYLSSAIAQAFAALIALTAMVYIYRKGIIDNKKKEICNEGRAIIAWLVTEVHVEAYPVVGTGKAEIGDAQMNYYKLHSDRAIINIIKALSKDNKFEKVNKYDLRKRTLSLLKQYEDLTKYGTYLKNFVIISLILSALATGFGLFALLRGPGLCCDQQVTYMIGESALSAIALGWTVFVVIKILKEPDQPKAEEGQG